MTTKKLSEKASTKKKKSSEVVLWKRLCATLLRERNQLRQELAKLQKESEIYKKSLGKLLYEEVVIDKNALLSQFGKEPSLAELIKELEQTEE